MVLAINKSGRQIKIDAGPFCYCFNPGEEKSISPALERELNECEIGKSFDFKPEPPKESQLPEPIIVLPSSQKQKPDLSQAEKEALLKSNPGYLTENERRSLIDRGILKEELPLEVKLNDENPKFDVQEGNENVDPLKAIQPDSGTVEADPKGEDLDHVNVVEKKRRGRPKKNKGD